MIARRRWSARRSASSAALAALGVFACVSQAGAQARAPAAVEFAPGGELENYLRLLQIDGASKWYPWSLRSFSSRELRALLPADSAAGPWRLSAAELGRGISVGPVGANAAVNSGFPYGGNDGAVWAGRGLTVSANASLTARLGPLLLTLAPVAFISTNAAFPLLDNGESGSLAFNDGLFPTTVDRPQRFGDGAYGRGDVGGSEIRLDTRLVTVGFGTAPMSWGPAMEYPFLVGTNAAGFPHAFLGTGGPVSIGVGMLHARAIWGKLSQSSFSPVTGADRYVSPTEPGRTRLMAGMMFIFAPRLIPNLEFGLGRFVHIPYPISGIDGSFLRRPWPRFLKKNVYGPAETREVDNENDLASVFARWTFPGAGFELYGEHGHDDWYHDLRDLVQEPEHNRSYMLGAQKVFTRSPTRMSALRAELINHQKPPLGRDRPGQGIIYTHTSLRQGHTQRGQLIGSSAGVGAAAGSVVAWDRYSPAGRTTLAWRRIVRAHTGGFDSTGVAEPDGIDVIHSLGAERSRRTGNLSYTFGVELMADLNRNFSNDVFNLHARAGMQWTPRRPR